MSRRLKTTILISSIILVSFIAGLLIFSMVSSVSSVEIYDFRAYEMPNIVNDVNSDVSVYEIYLNAQKEKNLVDISSVYTSTATVSYSFTSSDESVAVIENYEIATEDEPIYGYNIYGKKIGQCTFSVTQTIKNEDDSITEKELADFECIVYRELSDCEVYLSTENNSLKEFKILFSASNNAFSLSFESTNPEVAKVIVKDKKYYISPISAGTATIIAYCSGNVNIRDKFNVTVIDNSINELHFIDKNGNDVSSVTMYDDGKDYSFYYKLIGSNGETNVNANGVEIASFSTTPVNIINWPHPDISASSEELMPFDSDGVRLDKDNNRILVKKSFVDRFSETSVVYNVSNGEIPHALGFITLRTFIQASDGTKTITGTYMLNVNVYHKYMVATEIEVSASTKFEEPDPEFDELDPDHNTKVNKNIYNYSGIEWAGVNINDIHETIYYSSRVKSFYFKVWKVYNNGDREIEKGAETSVLISSGVKSTPAPDKLWLVAGLDDATGNVASSSYIINGIGIGFTYFEYDVINVEMLYVKDENNYYTYKNWDDRLRFTNEIPDENGNIVMVS